MILIDRVRRALREGDRRVYSVVGLIQDKGLRKGACNGGVGVNEGHRIGNNSASRPTKTAVAPPLLQNNPARGTGVVKEKLEGGCSRALYTELDLGNERGAVYSTTQMRVAEEEAPRIVSNRYAELRRQTRTGGCQAYP